MHILENLHIKYNNAFEVFFSILYKSYNMMWWTNILKGISHSVKDTISEYHRHQAYAGILLF